MVETVADPEEPATTRRSPLDAVETVADPDELAADPEELVADPERPVAADGPATKSKASFADDRSGADT